MSDIKIFIQYFEAPAYKYQELYKVSDGIDYYKLIHQVANNVMLDDFVSSIEIRDDTGDNISEKSDTFFDLTALYWYWKNVSCDVIGNDRSDKYFLNKPETYLMTDDDIEDFLATYDFIIHIATVPNKTVASILDDVYGEGTTVAVGEVIEDISPEYLDDYISVMNGYDQAAYNMMICRKSDFDAYCSWLFPVLFECENRITVDMTDDIKRKVFSGIAEKLLLVWLNHNNKTYVGDTYITDNYPVSLEVLCNIPRERQEINSRFYDDEYRIGTLEYESSKVIEDRIITSTQMSVSKTFVRGYITKDSTVNVSVSPSSIKPSSVSVADGLCTVVIPKQETAANAKIKVFVK